MATRATEAVRRRLADALTHIDEKDEQKPTDGGVFNAWVNIEGKAEAKLFPSARKILTRDGKVSKGQRFTFMLPRQRCKFMLTR